MELIFEWNATKARINLNKHKVSFDEAKTVFNDPFLLTFPDGDHSESENRYLSIGRSARGRMLLVVHTERKATETTLTIRIISCRKVRPSERKTYEES